jgi:hypothetical protein
MTGRAIHKCSTVRPALQRCCYCCVRVLLNAVIIAPMLCAVLNGPKSACTYPSPHDDMTIINIFTTTPTTVDWYNDLGELWFTVVRWLA